MATKDEEPERAETLVAALIYLMTHYARTGCPRLAVCVSRHMQCLAVHAETPKVVHDICAGLHDTWGEASGGRTHPRALAH